MIKRQAGFTLVELMITMAVFLLVLASVSSVFTGLLTQFKQQSKITETNIEGLVGLDMLRRDMEHAGYGLPWVIPGGVTYAEAGSTTACGTANPSSYNDAISNPPRAMAGGNNNCTNGSDYLAVKSASAATNTTSTKWTTLRTGDVKKTWDVSSENLAATDRVIVLSPGGTSNVRALVASGGVFYTQYSSTAAFAPADSTTTNVIYGIDANTNLRMPFNRADYYISTSNVPARCAPGSGVLVKTVISQADGGMTNVLPLLDCVVDMQVIYRLDTNADGTIDSSTDTIALTAQQTRQQLKEIRVYILAHEGQMDAAYVYPNATITVGEFGLGSTVTLSAVAGANWANYRWRVYTLVVKPNNLG